MLVKTTANQPVRLRLDRRLLSDFQLVGITPLPSQVKQEGRFYEFVLPASIDPQPIIVKFKCTRVGEYAMRATVMTTSENQAEWQTKVRVVEQVAAPKQPKGLAVIAMAFWR